MTFVRFTERAATQLEEALRTIEHDSPRSADLVRERIAATLRRLELFPVSGTPTDEPGIRYTPVPRTKYLLFYDLQGGDVRIVRVRHSARSAMQRR